MGRLLELVGALTRDRLIKSFSLQRRESTLVLLLQASLTCTSKFNFVLVVPSNLGLGSLLGLLQRTPTFQLSSVRICLRQTGGAARGH